MQTSFQELIMELKNKMGLSTTVDNKNYVGFRKNNYSGTLSIEKGNFTDTIEVLIIGLTNKDKTGELMPIFEEIIKFVAEWVKKQEKPYLIIGEENETGDSKKLERVLEDNHLIVLEKKYSELVTSSDTDQKLTWMYRTNQEILREFFDNLTSFKNEWDLFLSERSKLPITFGHKLELFAPSRTKVNAYDDCITFDVISIEPFKVKAITYSEKMELVVEGATNIMDRLMTNLEESLRLSWLVEEKTFTSITKLAVYENYLTHEEAHELQSNFLDSNFSFSEFDRLCYCLKKHLPLFEEVIITSLFHPGNPSKSDNALFECLYTVIEQKHHFNIRVKDITFQLIAESIDCYSDFIQNLKIIKKN